MCCGVSVSTAPALWLSSQLFFYYYAVCEGVSGRQCFWWKIVDLCVSAQSVSPFDSWTQRLKNHLCICICKQQILCNMPLHCNLHYRGTIICICASSSPRQLAEHLMGTGIIRKVFFFLFAGFSKKKQANMIHWKSVESNATGLVCKKASYLSVIQYYNIVILIFQSSISCLCLLNGLNEYLEK